MTVEAPASPRAYALSLGTGYFQKDSAIDKVVFNRNTRRRPDQAWKRGETSSFNVTDCDKEFTINHDVKTCQVKAECERTPLQPSLLKESIHAGGSRALPEVSSWNEESINKTTDLWELSNHDRVKLVELGEKLKDLSNHSKNNPADVARFLVANSSDISKSEKQFRKMVSWRKQHKVDQILDHYHPPKELVNYYPGAVLQGLDYDGDPIFVSRLGVTDAAGMLKRYGHEEMIKHAIWLRELLCTGQWMQKYEEVHNKPVKRAIVIEDVHNIQLLKIASNRPLLTLYSEVMRLDQDNYPEAAKKIFILRAPALFSISWNIAQHFFDPNVRDKMIFTSRNNYMEVLAQYMDLSVLPPCVVPGIGAGGPLEGMPPNFEGGPLPNH